MFLPPWLSPVRQFASAALCYATPRAVNVDSDGVFDAHNRQFPYAPGGRTGGLPVWVKQTVAVADFAVRDDLNLEPDTAVLAGGSHEEDETLGLPFSTEEVSCYFEGGANGGRSSVCLDAFDAPVRDFRTDE